MDKAAEAWRWPSTPSRVEVKERVELYLYSPSETLWPAIGGTVPLRIPYVIDGFLLKRLKKRQRYVIRTEEGRTGIDSGLWPEAPCLAEGTYITGRIQIAGHVLFLYGHHQLDQLQLNQSIVQTFQLLGKYERCQDVKACQQRPIPGIEPNGTAGWMPGT